MKRDTIITGLYEVGVYIVDSVLVLLAIYFAYMFKFNFSPPEFNYSAFETTAPFIVFTYLIFMYAFGLGDIFKQSIGEMIYSVFITVISLLIATMAITFFLRAFSYPRSVLIISTLFQFVLISIWRIFVWRIKRIRHGKKVALVIGNDSADKLAKKLITKQWDIYELRYISHGLSNKLFEYLDKSEVVFICEDVGAEIRDKVLTACIEKRKSVYVVPKLYEINLISSRLDRVDDIPVLKVKKLGLTIEQKIIKRAIDILFSILGIIVTLPIMIVIALLIKLQDRGPVFFKQTRVTEGDRIFEIIKFRTMIKDAEKLTGPVVAGENDPRITRLGRILRATRLDELPQLINILKGDMSIVGPRPERPYFVEQFNKEIPDYKFRTLVKAGLTGLAQVLGKYNTTAEDKVKYDILYIRNYSIFLDLKIILQTIKIVFMKESTEGVKEEISLENMIQNLDLEITVDKDHFVK